MSILDEFNDLHYTGESTESNIKIFLNLRDNGYLDFSGIDEYKLLYRIEELFVDYINRETEDLNEANTWDLLDNQYGFTESLGIYMLLDHLDGDLSFISSHEQLVRASMLFALQDFLQDSIYEWKCEFEAELSIRFNKFITLWRKRRDRKRKEIVDSLKIHCVQDVVMGYL